MKSFLSTSFNYGDTVTIMGKTGVVKKITLMHLVLEALNGENEILIPSGSVVTQMIQRKKSIERDQPKNSDSK